MDALKTILVPVAMSIVGTILIFTPLAPVGAFLLTTASKIALPMLIQAGLQVIEEFTEKPSMSMEAAYQRLNIQLNPQAQGKWVFGQTAAPGDIVYMEHSADNSRVLIIVAVAAHEIEDFGNFYVNDELVTFTGDEGDSPYDDTLWYREKLGTLTQTVMVTGAGFGGITTWNIQSDANFKFKGCAYYGMVWQLGRDKTQAGIPQRITNIVKGCKVYDPRLDSTNGGSGAHRYNDQSTWEYTNGGNDIGANWALVVVFYLLGWHDTDAKTGNLVFGVGVDPTDIDWPQVIVAANICDTTIDSKPRYRVGGVFNTDNNHEGVIKQLEAAIDGKVSKVGGKYFLYAPSDDTGSPFSSIDEDDILYQVPIQADPGGDFEKVYNTARGKYPEPTELYQPIEYPEVQEASAVTTDGGERVKRMDFAIVQDQSVAERVARMRVRRSRFPGKWKFAMSPKGLLFRPFDVTTLTCQETNNVAETVRILDMQFTMEGVVGITCIEEDSSIYDTSDALGTPVTQQDPSAFDPSASVSVSTFAGATATAQGDFGTQQQGVKLTWDDPGAFVKETIVQYKIATEADWSTLPPDQVAGNEVHIWNLEINTQYNFRAKHKTIFNVLSSAWATANVTTLGAIVLPQWGTSIGWIFYNTDRTWTDSAITATVNATYIALVSTGADPQFISPSKLNINGAVNTKIRAKVRRTDAGSSWQGDIFYKTSGHGFSGSYYKRISDITVQNSWVILEWDMANLDAGGTDWITNVITQIRIDFGAASGANFDVEWITVGDIRLDYGAETVYFDGGDGSSVSDREKNFDLEAGWINWTDSGNETCSVVKDSSNAYRGDWAIKMNAAVVATPDKITSVQLPCNAGEHWLGQGYIKCGAGELIGIELEFFDDAGASLGTSTATKGSTTYKVLNNKAVAPANTVSVSVAFYAAGGTTVTGYVDNVKLERINPVLHLTDGQVIIFGNDTDAQLEHDGTDLKLTNATGNYELDSGGELMLIQGQLNFPDTQNASSDVNTLDDYEEGTWTPKLQDDSFSDGEGQTYGVQVATYLKVGNYVFFTARIVLSSIGTLSGNVYLVGLPFTSNNTTNKRVGCPIGHASGLSITAGQNVGGLILPNTSYIVLTLWDATSGGTNLQASEFTDDGALDVSGFYQV